MKKTLLPLCFLALVIISCQQQSSELDKIITQCYDTTYQEKGYDIRAIIDSYEKELIKEGVLEDSSGESYLEVLEKIFKDKNFRITTTAFIDKDPFLKVDNETKLAIFQCQNKMITSLKEQDPKWQTVFADAPSPEIGTPDQEYQKIYNEMTETLSEADLNSYYFKLIMFKHFDGMNTHFRDRMSMPTAATDSL
ncbi:hypothetical protein [Muriicola sp.]|uniref:hypothetical protein n=1 Tax=Muriicola sp. TaxID=2020856 RepID=UPI003562C6E7